MAKEKKSHACIENSDVITPHKKKSQSEGVNIVKTAFLFVVQDMRTIRAGVGSKMQGWGWTQS